MNILITTSVLGLGLAFGAVAQDFHGRGVPAALEGQSGSDNRHAERTVTMPTVRRSPDAKIPPLDAAVPARTETAAFGLG